MHSSDKSLCMLLGAVILPATSAYISSSSSSSPSTFPYHSSSTSPQAPSSTSPPSPPSPAPPQSKCSWRPSSNDTTTRLWPAATFPSIIATFVARATGLIAATYTLALPCVFPFQNPVANTVFRIPTFFLSLKLLDLTLVGADRPPQLVRATTAATAAGGGKLGSESGGSSSSSSSSGSNNNPSRPIFTKTHHATYIHLAPPHRDKIRLLQHSSRRRVPPPPRPPPPQPQHRPGHSPRPLTLLPLAYLVPLAELHPYCRTWLFWQPFCVAGSARVFGPVAGTRGRGPFLYRLGYVPSRAVFTRVVVGGGRGGGGGEGW